MRRRYIFSTLLVVAATLFSIAPTDAASLSEKLAGRILLQVESKGEAWYVDPIKKERWYLGRPDDAFAVMRKLGLGITDANLLKIPRGDSADRGDAAFSKRFYGRILLQVQSHGEAWYVYPKDGHRYFLGRPADAFHMMRKLGLGITDRDIATIVVATGSTRPVVVSSAPTPPVVAAPSTSSIVTEPSSPPPLQTPAPSTVPSAPTPPSSTPTAQTFRADMLAHINGQRATAGVSALASNEAMHAAAQRFSDDMVSRNYFAVTTPEGLGAKEILKEAGYDPRAVGILIASGAQDAVAAFTLWNGGEQSKTLIVKSEYEELGVGFTRGGDDQNIWVVIFASSQAKYEQEISVSLADLAAIRQAMLTRVNQERSTNGGLPPLVLNDLLNQSAQKKSEDMFTRDYFAHESPDGVTPSQVIASTGYVARISAENLAKGPKGVDEVMTGWMNSPGHRANILFNGIEEAGFGLKFGRNASGFNLYWTQHFGKR